MDGNDNSITITSYSLISCLTPKCAQEHQASVPHVGHIQHTRFSHCSFPSQLGQSNITRNLRNDKKEEKTLHTMKNGVHGSDNSLLTHQPALAQNEYQASVTHASTFDFPLWFLTPAVTVPHASHIGHIRYSYCSFPPELNQSNLTESEKKHKN